MSVRDLIGKLQTVPPDYSVVVMDLDGSHEGPVLSRGRMDEDTLGIEHLVPDATDDSCGLVAIVPSGVSSVDDSRL